MSAYYDLHDDVNRVGRWFLKGPFDSGGREVDGRAFTDGRALGASIPTWEGEDIPLALPLMFRQREPGEPLDFTFADFEVPVVTGELGIALKELAGTDVQLVPATVEGQPGNYYVLNVTRQIVCVNEAKSRFQKWTEKDGRPEKVGDYRGIHPLIIEPEAVGASHMFRIQGWVVAIIGSRAVKELFERHGYTGLKFKAAVNNISPDEVSDGARAEQRRDPDH